MTREKRNKIIVVILDLICMILWMICAGLVLASSDPFIPLFIVDLLLVGIYAFRAGYDFSKVNPA